MSIRRFSHGFTEIRHRMEGRVWPPLLLWMLGVPGGIAFLLWVFVFRR